MTPFNVNEFLKGQPVVTRLNIEVEALREVKYVSGSYLTAMINGKPIVWNMQGVAVSVTDPNLDLFMTTPVVYHWVNSKYLEDTEPKEADNFVKVVIA